MLPSAWLNFRKWKHNYRVWIIFLIEFSYMWISTSEYKTLAVAKGLAVSGGFFAIWCSKIMGKLIMFLGILVLFCNAPFVDDQQSFLVIRIGKKKWMAGQLLYLFSASVIYFLIMLVFCALRFFPYVNVSNAWGDVIYSVAPDNALRRNTLLQVTPLQACTQSFVMCVLIAFFLGCLMLYINLYHKGTLAVGIGAACVCISYFVASFFTESKAFLVSRFSIVDWCDIDNYVDRSYAGGLSFPVTTGILIGAGLLLILLIYRKLGKD